MNCVLYDSQMSDPFFKKNENEKDVCILRNLFIPYSTLVNPLF